MTSQASAIVVAAADGWPVSPRNTPTSKAGTRQAIQCRPGTSRRGHTMRLTFCAGCPRSSASVTGGASSSRATWLCAQAHDSRRSGSSAATAAAGISTVGSGCPAGTRGRSTTAASSTTRTSHGRSRSFAPARAGVNIQGRSGGSNSMAVK